MTLTLRIFKPTLQGAAFEADLTRRATGWRRTIRSNGGFWLGSFSLSGDATQLAAHFYNWLGYHFEERSGGRVTWEGMVYEMELTIGGVGRAKSLDMMYNHVRTDYDNAGTPATTSAATNDESIARYGRREQILDLSDQAVAAANAYRDRYLLENAWPWARTSGVNLSGGLAELVVTVCGYAFTAGWRHETAGDASTDDLDDWISEIVTTDCAEFLSVGRITANTLQVKKDTSEERRAWDVLLMLAGLGDASDNPYRIYVDIGRRVVYEQISTTPLYYLRDGQIYTSAGGAAEVDPWAVKPAVVRDIRYPVGGRELGAWLTDIRDFYAEEVECSADNGLTLKTSTIDEAELSAAYESYLAELESEDDDPSAASSSSKPGRLNWKRKVGAKPGTALWDRLSRMSWQEKQAYLAEWRANRKKRG